MLQKFELPGSAVPPVDLEAERETVRRVLAYLDEAPSSDAARSFLLDLGARITPWVSQQLGCFAEYQADQGQLREAALTACVGVGAALQCHDSQRLAANLLTLAGVQLRADATDSAEKTLLQILELPFDEGFLERASANLSLAGLLAAKRPQDAREYYEQAVCCLGGKLPDAARERLADVMIEAYASLKDWVGGAYVCHSKNVGDMEAPFLNALQAPLELPQVIAADTRLRRLGADRLADQLYSMWCDTQRGGEFHATGSAE